MARQQPALAIEGSYTGYILRVLAPVIAAVKSIVLPALPRLVEQPRADARFDTAEEAKRIFDGIRFSTQGVTAEERIAGPVRDVGRRTSEWQGEQLERQVVSAVGVAVPINDPVIGQQLRNWTTENVALVKSVPGDMLDELERMVMNGVTTGQRWETVAESIEQRFEITERRAALIARDQVGKFYGSVQKARQESMGVTSYVWRTSLDERVRPEHAAREGKVFRWDDPPEDGPPGMAINCRCTAEPQLETLLDELEAAEAA